MLRMKPGHMSLDSGGQHLLEEQAPGLEQMNLGFPLLEKLYKWEEERKAMNKPNQRTRPPSKRVLLPQWGALLLTPMVFVLGHVAVPQELSVLSTRHGWTHGRPGRRNLLGLLLIGAGFAGLVWCLRLHFVSARGSFELEHAQRYLVVRGPYQFTRNPMYLCGMLIWLGWIIWYGSVAVLAGAVVFWGSVAELVVPWEERHLEARFGEAYLRYKDRIPRWLGRRGSR
jgi:protein-S-isoprenylcysteine O-methyltransferase Ste14